MCLVLGHVYNKIRAVYRLRFESWHHPAPLASATPQCLPQRPAAGLPGPPSLLVMQGSVQPHSHLCQSVQQRKCRTSSRYP